MILEMEIASVKKLTQLRIGEMGQNLSLNATQL